MRSRPLPDQLRTGPFTAAEALAAGVGRGRLTGPRVRRVFTGVFVASDLRLDVRMHVRAALLALPDDTLATGTTALWLHGAEVGQPRPLRFLSAHPHQVRRPGLIVTRAGVLPMGCGWSVSAEHAFASAATQLDLVELVSAGDWLIRLRRCTPASLMAYAVDFHGPRAAAARRAAGLVRRRVDSVRETRLRLCLVLAGLPEPRCNVTIGSDEALIGRVDMLLEEFLLILEYEGDRHREKGQWTIDIDRGEAFAAEGYRTIRVTAAHLRRPRALVARVYTALVERGYQGPAPSFTPEWCLLFERFAR